MNLFRQKLEEMQRKLAQGWQEQERRSQGSILGAVSAYVEAWREFVASLPPPNVPPPNTQYVTWSEVQDPDSWIQTENPDGSTTTWTRKEPEWEYVEEWGASGTGDIVWTISPGGQREVRRFLLRDRELPVRRTADGGLVGWRYWVLDIDRVWWLSTQSFEVITGDPAIMTLRSPHRHTRWGGPTLSALEWSDEAACEGHAGIHATLRPVPDAAVGFGSRMVTGRVRGYGRYVLGTRGWRAERVVIDYLRVPNDVYDEVKGPLSERYQCEVRRQWR